MSKSRIGPASPRIFQYPRFMGEDMVRAGLRSPCSYKLGSWTLILVVPTEGRATPRHAWFIILCFSVLRSWMNSAFGRSDGHADLAGCLRLASDPHQSPNRKTIHPIWQGNPSFETQSVFCTRCWSQDSHFLCVQGTKFICTRTGW